MIPHITGDGKRHPSAEAALKHANRVYARTGNLISVEVYVKPQKQRNPPCQANSPSR